jgi:hypothetical protein
LKLTGLHEIYPVFSWTLFSKVPQERIAWGLRIVAYNGQVLDSPLFYEEADGIVSDPRSISAQYAIRRMCRAELAGNAREVKDARRLLEQTYLATGIRYELVRVRYDPLTRWRSGHREIHPLKQYEVE